MIITVSAIIDHGTIIQVLGYRPNGKVGTVEFDHRMFAHLYDAEGDLVGRVISYDGESVEVDVALEDEDAD